MKLASITLIILVAIGACYFAYSSTYSASSNRLTSEAQWKATLSPLQYKVLREKGTEVPYTGELLNEHRKGTFVTADCGTPVFRSETKYDSGTGWPSFYAPIEGGVKLQPDADGS